ncbi:asparaginase [Lysinibacillus sp. 2017]|uniref:asparaginase n=1 Tax=unclassified Lysinibacillus TaxID=2636778 RepID=UPI000D527E04|nr:MULTISPECIES: asparaginase [unclassified Lysinibacillus]AWE06970.1 asparaginase [Lysinibacillus sp. 2017]TGN37105.1 asparaginase [Lysinibacillus sp. S2017]
MKKKVALITTGGTIASTRNDKNKLESGKLDGNAILSMCQLENELDIELVDLYQIPSMHMTFENLNQLNTVIHQIFKDESVNGIVITHGTDSLEETAYFLELTVNDPRPIIVTGSQKSSGDIGTDVYSNLRNSLLVASSDEAKNIGTCVVFNEKIIHSKYVKKVHSSSINGFGAIGYGMLGYIDNDEVIIYQKPTHKEIYAIKENYPTVEIVMAYLGASSIIIDALYEADVDGIVLVGAGRGQVTPDMTNTIEKLCQKGIKVILTTSTEEGRVFPTYDYYSSANNLKDKGVIMGGDYDPKKARLKLLLMLANEDTNYDSFMH